MDSIAQWTKALPTLPEICSSWHLQGATISIGANVRVGIFIPPSKIKISFVAFHFRCLIQFSQLHSIRSMDHITEGPCFSCSSCLVPAGPGLFIKVHQNHLQSFTVMFGLFFDKESFQGFRSLQVQSFTNFVFRMSNNVSRHMREVRNKFSLQKIHRHIA